MPDPSNRSVLWKSLSSRAKFMLGGLSVFVLLLIIAAGIRWGFAGFTIGSVAAAIIWCHGVAYVLSTDGMDDD